MLCGSRALERVLISYHCAVAFFIAVVGRASAQRTYKVAFNLQMTLATSGVLLTIRGHLRNMN